MREREWIRKTKEVFGVDDPRRIAAYCRENWAEDAEHVIRTADDACENTFLFDFRWDMERTWEPVHFDGEIDWSLIPSGDREFLWQFNRHRFLPCLAQAYRMTGEEKYAQNYVRLMSDWIRRAQPGENIDLGPWRTLETGIHAENWLCSIPLVADSPAFDDAFADLVGECLRKHQRRLADHFQPHKYISNWGVLEACGLLLLSLVLPDSGTEIETALKRLEDTANVQVLGDGMQWEQSPMYHNEVYHCFLTAYWYGTRAGIGMPAVVEDAVRRMAFVNYKWKKPDHTQFAQGDSDASDLRDQITAGAYVLQDGVLKSGGYERPDYDSIWRFGIAADGIYRAIQAEAPDFVSAELPVGGNYYLRSGWSEKDSLLHFHCGETGGGHGHADKLHVDLVIRGEDVLVDSGRYTYVDGLDRYSLKEAAAHNTVLVDGRGFADCETSWIYKNLCTCVKQPFYAGRLGGMAEGAHLGYWEDDVIVNRKVIWLKPDVYLIVDELLSHGDHTYEQYFHFDGAGEVKLCGENQAAGGQIHFAGRKMEAWMQFVPRGGNQAEGMLTDTLQSAHYNEIHANRTFVRKSRGCGPCCEVTVINGGEKDRTAPAEVRKIPLYSNVNDRILDERDAEGLQILCGGREYVLFLCHREIMRTTDILSWENCMGCGSVVVFDRTEEKDEMITGEVFAW